MPRIHPQVRSVFDRSAPRSSTTENVLSTVAFTLMLASWAVAYVVIVPADPVEHHAIKIAQVLR